MGELYEPIESIMIKSRTTQLIFQSIYIGIAIIAILASLGLFEMTYRWDFYVHFTNLSNYLCAIMMFLELHDTAKKEIGFRTINLCIYVFNDMLWRMLYISSFPL